MDRMLSIGDAAEQYGVHIETIRRWELLGYLKPIYTQGGHRRFSAKEFKLTMDQINKEKDTTDQTYLNSIFTNWSSIETELPMHLHPAFKYYNKIKKDFLISGVPYLSYDCYTESAEKRYTRYRFDKLYFFNSKSFTITKFPPEDINDSKWLYYGEIRMINYDSIKELFYKRSDELPINYELTLVGTDVTLSAKSVNNCAQLDRIFGIISRFKFVE